MTTTPGTGNAEPSSDPGAGADRIAARLREANPGGSGPVHIVDGNNVMGQRPGWWRDKKAAQRDLIERIADYARAEGMLVAVAFDGRPPPDFPDQTLYRGIILRFPRRGENADDLIARLVEDAEGCNEIRVVTSDRELVSRARGGGASVIRSGSFRRGLESWENRSGTA